MINLEGKNAIVTGSGRGIGFAIAEKLADFGANIIISDINDDFINEAIEKLKSKNVKVEGIKADVSKLSECENLINTGLAKMDNHIDILVNNAGVTRDNLIMRMKEEDWDLVLNINLKGIFNCSKAISRQMMKQRSGSIINIASIVGIIGQAGQTNYAASKGGAIAFTKALARELAGRNINVNAIAPGFIKTPMTDNIPEVERNKLINSIPLKRLGEPEDVANTVSFLCSEMAQYITGQVFVVDGGIAI